MDKQFVTVYNKFGLKETPTEENKQLYENIRVSQKAEQQEPYIKKRLDIIKRNVNKIVAGKRKKLMKSGVPESGKYQNQSNSFRSQILLIINN